MPTIIQVNNKSFKYHNLPLVAHFEEPLGTFYYVRNPEYSISKYSPKIFRIDKRKVEFAIKMKVLPVCKHCNTAMTVTKVEPYIHDHYRISFQCQNQRCRKQYSQTIYFENGVYN